MSNDLLSRKPAGMPTTTRTTTTTTSNSNESQSRDSAAAKQRPMTTNHSRHRSASDPFTDLNQVSPRSKQYQQQQPQPPPPPPKKHSKMPQTQSNQSDKPQDRARMGRSHTAITPTRESPSRTTHAGRRSQSQDSVIAAAAAVERAKTSAQGKRSKKSSQHADVIDRLDYSAVGLFHHDGPFDACAPSRNRQKNKAPMLAWSGRGEEAKQLAPNASSPYPSVDAYGAFSSAYPAEPPKKKVDAIAEAWGIHEPEPYEEFFAGGGPTETPASSIYNGREAHSSRTKRGKEEIIPPVPPVGRSRNRRSPMPPPQPIMVPDATTDYDSPLTSPPPNSAAPKRSKSLMQRIRKMRDAPNVPVSSDYIDNTNSSAPPSPSSPTTDSFSGQGAARPGHRSQNSFLGRFAPKVQQQQQLDSPLEQPEPFVLINNANDNAAAPQGQSKDLPAPPRTAGLTPTVEGAGGYFEQSLHSPGMGRKASLMKKVRGVVRGTKRE